METCMDLSASRIVTTPDKVPRGMKGRAEIDIELIVYGKIHIPIFTPVDSRV